MQVFRIGLANLLRLFGAGAPLALLNLALLVGVGTLAVASLGRDTLAVGIAAAVVTSTLGGLLVAAIARAPADISAPTPSVVVIYASLCADLVSRAGSGASIAGILPTLALAVVLAGLFLLLTGWFRLADAIKFLPTPVSAGFVTGIGLLVIWAQVPPLLGIQGPISRYSAFDALAQVKPGSLVVGGAAAFTMWAYPKLTSRGQAALPALAAGTALYYLIAGIFGIEHLGRTVGAIVPLTVAESSFRIVWANVSTEWLLSASRYVLPYAAFMALQATMNAAVSSVAVANITGNQADVNRTLKAQGIANMLCGALGGLPVSTVASLSLAAARSKEPSAAVSAISCVTLGGVVFLAGNLLAYLPLAALAGILIMTGVNLIDRWARGLAGAVLRRGRRETHLTWNLALVAAVAAVLIMGSVPLALLVGAVLAMVLLAINLSAATTFGSQDASNLSSTRVWPTEQAEWLMEQRKSVAVFRPRGALFFGTADQLARRLALVPKSTRYCVLDLAKVTTLDATACQILAAGAKKLAAAGTIMILAGIDPAQPRGQALVALGLTYPDAKTSWCQDLDHALERVEAELLKARWPDVALDTPVSLSETPLARNVSPLELQELRSFLTTLEVGTGRFFKCGDPAASMFVVDRGLVEICVAGSDGVNTTRLAAFGPGSIFGEISLLSSDHRTADAICIQPARLYELSREALLQLQERFPQLHARLVANLSIHLANRLVIATGTVQAQ